MPLINWNTYRVGNGACKKKTWQKCKYRKSKFWGIDRYVYYCGKSLTNDKCDCGHYYEMPGENKEENKNSNLIDLLD